MKLQMEYIGANNKTNERWINGFYHCYYSNLQSKFLVPLFKCALEHGIEVYNLDIKLDIVITRTTPIVNMIVLYTILFIMS